MPVMEGASTSLQLQILSQLGELQQSVGLVQAQAAHIIKEQASVADGRRETNEKLNAFALVAAEVKRIAPLVDDHEQINQRAIGAVWAGRALWGVLSGAVGAGITILLSKIGIGPTPH